MLQVQSWLQASNNTGILNICTPLWLTESEQATPVDSIKDVVRSSVKVPEFDKHLKKAIGHIGRNAVEITIKMKIIVRKPLMIKIYNVVWYIYKYRVLNNIVDRAYVDLSLDIVDTESMRCLRRSHVHWLHKRLEFSSLSLLIPILQTDETNFCTSFDWTDFGIVTRRMALSFVLLLKWNSLKNTRHFL